MVREPPCHKKLIICKKMSLVFFFFFFFFFFAKETICDFVLSCIVIEQVNLSTCRELTTLLTVSRPPVVFETKYPNQNIITRNWSVQPDILVIFYTDIADLVTLIRF